MTEQPETTIKLYCATGLSDRQSEQFALGYNSHNSGFPRAAPHDESEWRYWLKGWDCAQMDREVEEHLNGK